MALQTHLKRRGATYYARVVVPVDLQEVMGKIELAKSLGTSDPKEAKRQLTPVIDGWQREFDSLRRKRGMTEADFAEATWQHYTSELEIDGWERALPAGDASPALRAMSRGYQLKELRKHLGVGETVLVHWAADAFIAKNGLLVEPGSLRYRELCFRLMRAQIEVLQRADERDQGNYTGKAADPVVVRPVAPETPVAKPGESVMDLFEQYATENPKSIALATLAQARRDIGTFVSLVGKDFPATSIGKKSVREWKALLLRYPVKASEMLAFKGMGFREIVTHNETVGKPVITHKTVNRYMAGFGGFCNWLAAHDYIDANPFGDMYLTVDKTTTSTETFTVDHMNTLFASPLFTGCKNDTKWHIAGDHLIRDHRYWLPLVMMFSGARPGEIAQLLIDDVQEQHEQWVMVITEDGDDTKSVKNKGSARVVPVHSELVRLGFIEFWKRQKAAGNVRLFPEAVRNSAGQIAVDFESKFGKYLTKLGIKDGRGLSLYSFRHGFVDALRRAEYLDAQFGFVIGHGGATMTGRYGKLPQGMLKQRIELVEAVDYPGVALPQSLGATR
jgi:integrase